MLIVRIVFEIWKSNRYGGKKERITGNKKNIKVKNKKSHHYMMTFNNKSCQKPTIELAGRLGKNLALAHWTLDISEVILASKSLLI